MRFYILDDVVSPVDGSPLRVEGAQVERREGPTVEPCKQWCGYRGAPVNGAEALPCTECQQMWVVKGRLSDGGRSYPIVNGIPRFVSDAGPSIDEQTQTSFGYEWRHFNRVLPDYDREIANYFGSVPADSLRDSVVLDAGCGMGRWARYVVRQEVRRLYAVDFSEAVDVAAETLRDEPRAHMIQADVCALPFRAKAMDFTYCLGVLHHLREPDKGMENIDRVTRGDLLVYLYYALENRTWFHRALLRMVTAIRKVTSRLPKRVMFVLAWLIALVVYWPLARLARLLSRAGFHELADGVPLSHYRDYGFMFMVGDAFDRFATPIERRYRREAIAAWLSRYGRAARFSERTPYWVTLGLAKK